MMDIHSYQARMKAAMRSLEKWEITDRNKELITQFSQHQALTGIGLPRRLKYIEKLRNIAKYLKKDFDKVEKADIEKYVMMVANREDYAKSTKIDFNIILKRFYKWLLGNNEEYPPQVKWLKTNLPFKDKTLPTQADLVTQEEVDKIVEFAHNARDKALISLLYESGTRIGEIANLKLGNIMFDQYGCVIGVNGKTGHRRIRVVNCVSHLTRWLELHPRKNDRGSPLWISLGPRNFHEQIRYSVIRGILKQLFKKSGITKKCNPHMFRHSRATFLANYMTEAQMKAYFGWVQHSDMASIYVHLSGRDTDNAILKMHGLSMEEEKIIKHQPKTCAKCGTINSHDSNYCTKCSGILDTETAIQLQEALSEKDEKHTKANNIMELLLEDPEFKQLMFKKMMEMKLSEKVQSL